MKISPALQKRIDKVVHEHIAIIPYNPAWPISFKHEKKFLKNKFPTIIKRLEHFGSTAVPDLSAKPIIDMLIEITSFNEVKKKIVPVLKALGYDYFWRPEIDQPPMYAWFIKRDARGARTHHLHMVKANSKLWDRLHFRDYLISHPQAKSAYEKLKYTLSQKFPHDREAYTKAKTKFIATLTEKAKKLYQNRSPKP